MIREKIDIHDLSNDNLAKVLDLHAYYAKQLSIIDKTEIATGSKNKFKADIILEQQKAQKFLSDYFESKKDCSKTAVSTATEILQRRQFENNHRDKDGNKMEVQMVHIGLDFIHEQFNDGKLFPLATYFSLFADSGVGKSDYFYRMTNSFLMQGYKVMICSFEIGEQRLANILDSIENGGKDRLYEARIANKFDNLYVNYQARDLESLELMIDIANENGISVVLIDSFGEIVRTESEYILQQKITMMLNAKVNDYKMFIGLIGQTKAGEMDGDYTVRGGTDQIFKPDLSIHVKKISKEDTSGERIVHLFKNREADINGKTIITKYDFEKREPTYKCDYTVILDNGKPARKLFGK